MGNTFEVWALYDLDHQCDLYATERLAREARAKLVARELANTTTVQRRRWS